MIEASLAERLRDESGQLRLLPLWVSMPIVNPLGATLLLAAMLVAQGSASLPWVFPGDFRERLCISDLVVSGTIQETVQAGSRTVDGTKVTANVARLRVDRVFEGNAAERELRITWFNLHWEMTGKGFAYSGPPLADFRPGKRYLVFFRLARSGWEVAMRNRGGAGGDSATRLELRPVASACLGAISRAGRGTGRLCAFPACSTAGDDRGSRVIFLLRL